MTMTTTATPTPSPIAANNPAIRDAAALIKTKDLTAAERQARYRERKRTARAVALRDAVTVVTEPRVTPVATVTVMPPERRSAPWTAALLASTAVATGTLALTINKQGGSSAPRRWRPSRSRAWRSPPTPWRSSYTSPRLFF